jgi:hypothetical protein
MKTKLVGCFLLGLALILTLSISARPDRDDRDRHDRDDRKQSENHKHNLKGTLSEHGSLLYGPGYGKVLPGR